MKTAVVFWSGSGNTEMMAQEIAQGMKEAGAEAEIFEVSDFSADKMGEYDAIAFGCPAMGLEELEDGKFAPVFETCRGGLKGKKIALFGSYGWGDGEWMRNWEAQCEEDGAVFVREGLICCEEPDEEAKEACRNLGKTLAQE